jgi:hypothetical protein
MPWIPIARRKRFLTKRDSKEWEAAAGAPVTLFDAGERQMTRALCYGTDFVEVVVWQR